MDERRPADCQRSSAPTSLAHLPVGRQVERATYRNVAVRSRYVHLHPDRNTLGAFAAITARTIAEFVDTLELAG